ncbi:hypothetical protein BDR03DRAFT_985176 [Suillus americanus]|nr:hypothetical protein BDR03DRAFT_985176 [Suillus americanus]
MTSRCSLKTDVFVLLLLASLLWSVVGLISYCSSHSIIPYTCHQVGNVLVQIVHISICIFELRGYYITSFCVNVLEYCKKVFHEDSGQHILTVIKANLEDKWPDASLFEWEPHFVTDSMKFAGIIAKD